MGMQLTHKTHQLCQWFLLRIAMSLITILAHNSLTLVNANKFAAEIPFVRHHTLKSDKTKTKCRQQKPQRRCYTDEA